MPLSLISFLISRGIYQWVFQEKSVIAAVLSLLSILQVAESLGSSGCFHLKTFIRQLTPKHGCVFLIKRNVFSL